MPSDMVKRWYELPGIGSENWHGKQAPQRLWNRWSMNHWLPCPWLPFKLWTNLWLCASGTCFHYHLYLNTCLSLICIITSAKNHPPHLRTTPLHQRLPITGPLSCPYLPLWVFISLEFWELIISCRKSTRCCKQKENFQQQNITCEVRNKLGMQDLISFLRLWPL